MLISVTSERLSALFLVLLLSVQWLSADGKLNLQDPGVCDQKGRGKQVIVKDHNNNDRILFCLNRNGKYQWIMNGNSYGNYFNPVTGCSDMVGNAPDARDGIYWIKTKNGPKKAWCDLVTDGGGFMLIGVKDTPVTWAIPSSPSIILPQGKAQWSSAFGDQQVLDFRIQISKSTSFEETHSHWYYRFQFPRKLSSLLLRNQGQCSHNHPGIGNVAFVKDLMRNKVVAKKFKCSRFGAHFFKGLGWAKMNACFEKECPKGFAHIGGFQYDSAGSFSFSAVSSKSGIRHNSTAFLGCDNGECCACFGPDSKQDYCGPRCQAINGGTILKKGDKIHVWFWIRSSLSKRVWKKCMEYEKMNSSGQLETWHIKETGRRKKGPCSITGEVKMNDGVVVVSSNRSMNNLPKIEGLLSYRSDQEKLFLRGKSQWNALKSNQQVDHSQSMIQTILGNLTRLAKDVRSELTSLKKENTDLRLELGDYKTRIRQELDQVKESIENLTVYVSCKQALEKKRNASNGWYKIKTLGTNAFVTDVYCQMTSLPGCSDGGWTMAMKIDGKKAVIVTTTVNILRQLTFEPLPAEYLHAKHEQRKSLQAIDDINTAPSTKIFLQTQTRFWEDENYNIQGGFSKTNLPIGQIHYVKPDPKYVNSTKQGIIMVYIWNNDALIFGPLRPDQVKQEAIEQIAKIHPEIKQENMVEKSVVHAWYNKPSYQGAFGFLKTSQFNNIRTLWEPMGNVHFAGETILFAAGWIQGALESGLKAAYQVYARGKERTPGKEK